MDLPTLDFARWTKGDHDDRLSFANDLANSFKKYGFVKMINHSVPDEVIQELFEWSKRYFHMPLEAKEKSKMEMSPGPQRGWIPHGVEKTSGLAKIHGKGPQLAPDKLSDQRESYDIGPSGDTRYPNLWPAEEDLPGFRRFIEKYFSRCRKLCAEIITAAEIGLNVPVGCLTQRCKNDASELRFNYYPSTPVETLKTGASQRSWPHTDFGIITLLFQDAVGGLELEDRARGGSFVPVVNPPPGAPTELVVNTADCLTRWTNNVISAGLHQVNVPLEMQQVAEGYVPDRYTCPFFLKADYDVSVGPVPAFVNEERPAAYDEISAIEYHRQRVKVVYEGLSALDGTALNGTA